MPREQAEQIIQNFRFADQASLLSLVEIRDDPTAAAASAALLALETDRETLWAAALIYAHGGDDPALLRPLALHPEPAIRVIAGAGLTALGSVDGFAPLIAELDNVAVMPGTHPPQPTWQVAMVALIGHTGFAHLGPAFDADPTDLRAAQGRWRAWLELHRSTLRFDPGNRLWRQP